MDPDATWKIVTDESLPLDERATAALNLLVWLAKGGGLPHYSAVRVRMEVWSAQVVEECELLLCKALDAFDPHAAADNDPVEAVLDQIRQS